MPLPQHPPKHASEPLFTAHDNLSYLASVGRAPTIPTPRAVVLCYQRALVRHIVADESPPAVPFVAGTLYPLPSTEGQVAVCSDFGIGAPAVTLQLEVLIALGVSRFISIGTAGGLQPDMPAGSLAVCSAAVRDEGVSHHYMPDEPALAEPASWLTERFASELAGRAGPVRHGPSWTTDAPFRETHAEVAHYQARGVLTVEMEAAALFAVARVRGVEMAAGFVVSDSLAAGRWHPQFDAPATQRGLVLLFEAARATLA